ncbi:MAG: LamG-like jellyroll fold domain-containing protein [Sandaracinaceae bacterium]
MSTSIQRVSLAAGVLGLCASLTACTAQSFDGCGSDVDCRYGRVCRDSVCVDPPPGTSGADGDLPGDPGDIRAPDRGDSTPPDLSSAVVRYPFDRCDDTTPEAMGTGLDATLVHARCEGRDALGAALGTSWRSGMALSCHGRGAFAEAPDDPTFEPSQLTLSAWVYSEDYGACAGHCTIVSKGNTDVPPMGYWLIADAGSGDVRLTIAGDGAEPAFYGEPLSPSVWHHVVATFDGTTAALYVDGALSASKVIHHGISYADEPFLIGAIPRRSYDFSGLIEEVVLWDRAMDAQEIADLYESYLGAMGSQDPPPEDLCDGTLCPCTEAGIRAAVAAGGGPYTFDCDGPTTVVTRAEIAIDRDVILDGSDLLTVDGNRHHRVFRVNGGATVEMRRITITGGRAERGIDGWGLSPTVHRGDAFGGAIANNGTLTLAACTISGNAAVGHAAYGGAFFNLGTALLRDCDFFDNDGYHGGAIWNTGVMWMTQGTVSDNSTVEGGGVHNGQAGELVVWGTIVDGNAASRHGGGVFNDGTLTMVDVVVRDNTADEAGGGIYNERDLTLTRCVLSDNVAGGNGGGLTNEPAHHGETPHGVVVMNDCEVSGNQSGSGGGLYNIGRMSITGTAVFANVTEGGGGGIDNDNSLTVTNTTVSGNRSNYRGGGVYNQAFVSLTSTTVSGNFAAAGGDALAGDGLRPGGGMTVANSVIEGDCDHDAGLPSEGYNIESPGSTCAFDRATDRVYVPAAALSLQPLADNGGPTQTHALGLASVAIDRIPETHCVDAGGRPLATDQRGVPRPQEGGCDVGAFEVEGAP